MAYKSVRRSVKIGSIIQLLHPLEQDWFKVTDVQDKHFVAISITTNNKSKFKYTEPLRVYNLTNSNLIIDKI